MEVMFMSHSHALIIDDNQNNIDVLAMMLTNEGCEYTSAKSVRDLLRTLDELAEKVDIVFLDLEFPHDDGFKILDGLKIHPNLKGVPIVAYSVHTSEIARARQAGFYGFLGKPLNRQRFPEQLKRLLAGKAVWEV
jgi:two-component system, cell cycle response regulator DivK